MPRRIGYAAVGAFLGLCVWIGMVVLTGIWPTLHILLPVHSIWVGLFIVWVGGYMGLQAADE